MHAPLAGVRQAKAATVTGKSAARPAMPKAWQAEPGHPAAWATVPWDFRRIPFVPPASGAGGILQCKLEIGAIDDPLEREADRVAEQVLDQSAPAAAGGLSLQRKCQACDDNEKIDHTALIRTKAGNGVTPAAGSAPTIVHDVLRSGGRPLDPVLRASLEPRFGYNFHQVRVHIGAMAGASAQVVRARAYTVGTNIVFGDGQYAPATAEGRRLIAHELAHIVQQRTGATVGGGGLRLQRQPCKPQDDTIPTGPLTPTSPGITCEPSPETLEKVRGNSSDPPTILGVTGSSFGGQDISYQEKRAMRCKATVTKENTLAITTSMFTKAGTYDDGTEVTPPGRRCPRGATVHKKLLITDAMAQKIKQGEAEHCEDRKYAFSISAGKFNQAVKDLAATEYCPHGPPLEDKGPDCKREFRERFQARTGVAFDRQNEVMDCLVGKSKNRDTSHWHDLQSDAGTYDEGCRTVTYTPDPALVRNIGNHPPSAIIKDCGEGGPAATAQPAGGTAPAGQGSAGPLPAPRNQ